MLALPVPHLGVSDREPLPPLGVDVPLPPWAGDLGPGGGLWVPKHTTAAGEGPLWTRTDWFAAAHWYLHGLAERAYEQRHGPIHSYAFRLRGWNPRFWERAWVNRIALFLRRWSARELNRDERTVFGPLVDAEVLLTHDVDAVRKTMAVRTKQTAFDVANAARHAVRGRIGPAARKVGTAVHFLTSASDYWRFDEITELERAHGRRSVFHFYAGRGGWSRTLRGVLFDPAYSVEQYPLRQMVRAVHQRGWTVGLHPSFEAWDDPGMIAEQRARLEHAVGATVTVCRQHWLRFSWRDTWRAQEQAGLLLDLSLGFNDRPGFRNGTALRFRPLAGAHGGLLGLECIPLVLMDSHVHDYAQHDDDTRLAHIRYWIDEIHAVHGVGSVVWHQRVMSPDYGWGRSYAALLTMLQTPTAP